MSTTTYYYYNSDAHDSPHLARIFKSIQNTVTIKYYYYNPVLRASKYLAVGGWCPTYFPPGDIYVPISESKAKLIIKLNL